VVKVIWHKAASPPHMDGLIACARWCQCTPHLTHACLWAHPRPQPKRHLYRFSRFCAAHGTVPIFYNEPPLFSLEIATLQGDLLFHLIHGSFTPSELTTQTAYRSAQTFLQGSRPTDHATLSITIGRIYVVLRCGLIIPIT